MPDGRQSARTRGCTHRLKFIASIQPTQIQIKPATAHPNTAPPPNRWLFAPMAALSEHIAQRNRLVKAMF
jgi:hypothetical protein